MLMDSVVVFQQIQTIRCQLNRTSLPLAFGSSMAWHAASISSNCARWEEGPGPSRLLNPLVGALPNEYPGYKVYIYIYIYIWGLALAL